MIIIYFYKFTAALYSGTGFVHVPLSPYTGKVY